MKTYKYTGRDGKGALKEGHIAASDRTAALQAVREKGLTPVHLEEGRARSLPKGKPPLAMAGLAVIVLVCGLFAIRWLRRDTVAVPPAPPPETAPARPPAREKESRIEPEQQKELETVQAVAEPEPETARPVRTVAMRRRTPAGAATTEEAGTEEGSPQELAAVPEPPKRRIPESTAEQLLLLIGRPGQRMPPVPPLGDHVLEREFEKFLNTDLTIQPDDTPGVADDKQYLQWMRQYMQEYREEGISVREFLDKLQELRIEEDLEIRESLKLYSEVRRENPAEAETALKELNANLESRGLPPIKPRQFPFRAQPSAK